MWLAGEITGINPPLRRLTKEGLKPGKVRMLAAF